MPFGGEQGFQPQPIKEEPGNSQEDKLAREWYNDTSWEGRSPREFQELRKELRETTSLDFTRYFDDKDYHRLLHENPRMQQLTFREETVSLMALRDRIKEAGISPRQFEKLLPAFSPQAVKEFRKNQATEELLRGAAAHTSGAEAAAMKASITHRMEHTIETLKKKDN